MSTNGIAGPLLLAAALLAGCASLPTDLGRGDVVALVGQRGLELPADTAGAERLRSPESLTREEAVRVALANNPRLRAHYAELGIAAAEVYNAGRLGNPQLSAAILFPAGGNGGNQTTFGLVQSLTDLLLLSTRNRFAAGEFERVKLTIGAEILKVAAEAERGYFRLVSAQQVARMRQAIARAAQVSAELAERFLDAGNVTALQVAQERAAAAQAMLDQMEAEATIAAARAELGAVLGARAATWSVAEQLSLPPDEEDRLEVLLAQADASRLDLAAARKRLELMAGALGIARRYRFLGDVEVGIETTRESDGLRMTGPTLSVELPVFNQGAGRLARNQAQLQQAEAELTALEVDIVNSIHRAAAGVASARARIGQFRAALIPQREEIVRRMQEQVNYMLLGQFELLLAKQQEYAAYQGYLEAVRDYWLARTELAYQVGAPLPSAAGAGPGLLDVPTLIAPQETTSPPSAAPQHPHEHGDSQ